MNVSLFGNTGWANSNDHILFLNNSSKNCCFRLFFCQLTPNTLGFCYFLEILNSVNYCGVQDVLNKLGIFTIKSSHIVKYRLAAGSIL